MTEKQIQERIEKLATLNDEQWESLCKGCGVCVSVCPTNPKSLLMFDENESNEDAIKQWPEKEVKAK